VIGDLALEAMLQGALIRECISTVGKVRNVVFASENFPYEADFIEAFEKNGHDRYLLFAHGGVRAWDIKYSRLPQIELIPPVARASIDREVVLAIGGKVDEENLVTIHETRDSVAQVEALRLMGAQVASPRTLPASPSDRPSPVKVLVMGDYLAEASQLILSLVELLSIPPGAEFAFRYRPHPLARRRETRRFARLADLSRGSLDDDLHWADRVIASSSSSGPLLSVLAAKPVAAVVSRTAVNFSPRVKGIVFVRSPDSLLRFLTDPVPVTIQPSGAGLNLQPGFHRWLDLLQSRPKPDLH